MISDNQELMMRLYLTIFVLLFTGFAVVAQTAEDYFPDDTGHKWYFRVTPIDSLGQLITELSVVKADSFGVEANLFGRESKGLLTKSAPQNSLPFLPYLDTLVYSVDGNTVSQYFDFGAYVDTSLIGDPGLVALLNSLRDWYPIFDFDNPVGNEYELFSKDTIITINEQNIPLRLEVDATRENDENISTILGNLNTKKFEVSFKLSFLINLPPPLPPIPVRLLTYPNYFWIAEDHWIVKEYAPQSVVDLSDLGFESFYIPGRNQELIEEPAYIFIEEPLPGQVLFTGDSVNISWRSRNTESVRVEVSADSGYVWETIHESHPAKTGTAPWFIDSEPSAEYFVKVTSLEDTFAVATNLLPFEVREKPVLNLTANLAGFELAIGDTINLTWEALYSELVNIYVINLATSDKTLIGENIDPDIGSFDWEVQGPVSNSLIIRIEDSFYTRFYDESESFAIVAPVSIVSNDIVPRNYLLDNPYPNPFNPATTISFGLPEPAKVRIQLYNILGQNVLKIADSEFEAGYHNIKVYAENLPSGLYFINMQSNQYNFTKKVILMK